MNRIKFDADMLAAAARELRLSTVNGWSKLQDAVLDLLDGDKKQASAALHGFGRESIKKMLSDSEQNKDRQWPLDLPRVVVQAIDDLSNIDVRTGAKEDFENTLREGISLRLGAEQSNEPSETRDHYTLKDLRIEFQDIRDKVAGPDDRELTLIIGFDETQLIIEAEGLPPRGANMHIGEVTGDTDLEAESFEQGYIGHFRLHHQQSSPLRWKMTPRQETALLKGVLEVRDDLAQVYAPHGTKLRAFITASAKALSVRILEPDGAAHASTSRSEAHRRKMEQALARKDIAKRTQFILCDEDLPTEPARG